MVSLTFSIHTGKQSVMKSLKTKNATAVRHFKNLGRASAIGSAVMLLSLSGCGGSSAESGVSGGGQEPDPVVVDIPIAYIERPLALDEEGELVPPTAVDRNEFQPGAALYFKERATDGALITNITENVFGLGITEYDIKDLSAHPLADRLLFTMRAPELEDVDEEDQPKWNVWEYNIPLKDLRRIIESDIVAEAADDISPRYLPDGRIIFSSTRQVRSRAILLDDNKPQYASQSDGGSGDSFFLHSMAEDGLDIQQLTFNQGQDWNPLVLQNGKIVYTKEDAFNDNRISFYTMNPDGTQVNVHYGYESFNAARNGEGGDDENNSEEEGNALERLWPFSLTQMFNGQLVGILKPRSSQFGGDMVIIDVDDFIEHNMTVLGDEIEIEVEEETEEMQVEATIVDSIASMNSISILPVLVDGEISLHGTFASIAPLHDGTNRLVVSWSQCRLQVPEEDNRFVPCTEQWLETEGIEPAPPLYGLWIYNIDDKLQQPVVVPREDVFYSEVVTLESRTPQQYLPPNPDFVLAEEGVGVLHIRSVYDIDGIDVSPAGIDVLRDPAQTSATERPARFLRILKAVSMPSEDFFEIPNNAFGFGRVRMKEIIGYTPIEPDGSVKVKLPADVALTFSVVNAAGERISTRRNNWFQIRPGETRECIGCYNGESFVPFNRPDAGPASINTGAPTTGVSFPNTEPALFADMGETMAEVFSRLNGIRAPTVAIKYQDIWTDPIVRDKDTSFIVDYSGLPSIPGQLTAPVSEDCQDQWETHCRMLIQYIANIQPIWDKSRLVSDALGAVVENNTCTTCHSTADADELVQIPAAHLNLTPVLDVNQDDFLISYVHLRGNRVEQEIVGSALINLLVDTGRFQRDEETDELILDAEGNPIPILETVPIGGSMSSAGAIESGRFFSRMTTFDPEQDTVDHRNWLNSSENKLLKEWLDIGAQYYNNPFDAVIPD